MTECGTRPDFPAVQRLFFALWPDEVTAPALRAAQQTMRQPGTRQLHPDDLHLTLVFLGDVAAERLPCIRAVADQVSVAPFDFILTRHGYWRGPRVTWLAPEQTPPGMTELVDRLWSGLAPCGFSREARPFSAHLTLARKARSCAESVLEDPIPWQVRDFVLVTSRSAPEPPRYAVLHRWRLSTGLENQ